MERIDNRRCGKCHHFRDHTITIDEIKKERTITCTVCGEKTVENIEKKYGNPFPDL